MTLTAVAAPHPDDTIVAVSSASGPAPRAIIRVGGPNARAVVAQVFVATGLTPPTPLPAGRGKEGTEGPDTLPHSPSPSFSPSLQGGGWGVGPANSHPVANAPGSPALPAGWGVGRRLIPGSLRLTGVHSPLPAMLYFFAGPRSYTGQDIAEIHTVGSPPLVERLVADLLAVGARPARPGEFTMRAFLAGKKDLPQAEAVQAVIEAGTDADLTAALTQLAGGVSRPLEALRDDLLNLLADVEAALDFADEDIEFVGKADTLRRIERAIEQMEAVQKQLDDRTISGRPVRVAIVGLPNAGKSSLFNALAGGTALVSSIPGTTRDYLTKSLTLAGVAVELIDTAGWQDASDTIEEQAQRLGREQTMHADVIVWCDERGEIGRGVRVEPVGGSTPAIGEVDESRLNATGAVVLKLRTKSDLLNEPRPHGSGLSSPLPCGRGSLLSASVVAPNGLDALRDALGDIVVSLTRPALAPSQSRCRHHVIACLERLREGHALAANDEPPELLALTLRGAIDALGEMTGAVHTNDLLDRIFSRFCIGK